MLGAAMAAGVMLALAPAGAAEDTSFYAGKTLTIFAGLPPEKHTTAKHQLDEFARQMDPR